MGAKTGPIGTHMPGMRGAFVEHFKGGGGQSIRQDLLHLSGNG